ncbi:hypothetical protein CDL15_Pgr014102 [Punica granatum]|uniref:Uncharacterized protein n=1 Tax=Punica granatum TaxID=22663 RepID=A0A218VWP8_PUNGR|nr:hypothetical protein CDL15_Pgr014102 [Punica granatum]
MVLRTPRYSQGCPRVLSIRLLSRCLGNPTGRQRLRLFGSIPAQADDLRNVLVSDIHQFSNMRDFYTPFGFLE